MTNKSQEIRDYIESGEYEKALRIGKTFRKGEKEDLSRIKRAYECYTNERFYKQLGYDIDVEKQEGLVCLKKLVNY